MKPPARLHWIDWLKVLVVGGIVLYHSALPYTHMRWVVNDRSQSVLLDVLALFGFQWGIPLLFVLAGASTWYALQKRGAARFLGERALRLGVPLVLALILLSPAQAYVQDTVQGRFEGDFIAYLPVWLRSVAKAPATSAWLSAVGYHIWFLGFLLAYSALALPLFEWWRAGAGRLDGVAAALSRPLALLALGVAVAVAQVALRPDFHRYTDWADFARWFAYFVFGCVLVSHPAVVEAVRNVLIEALVAGCAMTLALAGIALAGAYSAAVPEGWNGVYLSREVLVSANGWAWTLVWLSLGVRFLDRGAKWLPEAVDATLPVYIVSHPIVVVGAAIMLPLRIAVEVKFVLLGSASLLASALLYVAVIRPLPPLRLLFGLRARPRRAPLPQGEIALPSRAVSA